MNCKEYDNITLDKLHKVELEILDEVVRICKKHQLEYFLCGGSLLGAVRHEGFIPWDDDIDIGMTRKDYNLFIKYAQNELNDKFTLDCFELNKEYYLPFAKLKKNNTIFDEEDSHHLKNHKGIFIDIVPFENANKSDSLGQKIQAIIVRNITDTVLYREKIRKLKEVNHPAIVIPFSIFSRKTLMSIQKKVMCLNKNDNSKYVVALAGSYEYRKETNLRENVLPTKKIKFCGKMYSGMNKPDVYLSKIYGSDYMKLPSKEKRVNHMPLKIKF